MKNFRSWFPAGEAGSVGGRGAPRLTGRNGGSLGQHLKRELEYLVREGNTRGGFTIDDTKKTDSYRTTRTMTADILILPMSSDGRESGIVLGEVFASNDSRLRNLGRIKDHKVRMLSGTRQFD